MIYSKGVRRYFFGAELVRASETKREASDAVEGFYFATEREGLNGLPAVTAPCENVEADIDAFAWERAGQQVKGQLVNRAWKIPDEARRRRRGLASFAVAGAALASIVRNGSRIVSARYK